MIDDDIKLFRDCISKDDELLGKIEVLLLF